MPNATTLTMTLDELTALRRALGDELEKRKGDLDKAIFKQEQSCNLWQTTSAIFSTTPA